MRAKISQQQAKNIIFTGYVTDGQLAWLYQNAQAYVFPSLSEGFGLPGLEAMQYGLPVIASAATSLPEVYDKAALYFNPHDSGDLADKIEQVITDLQLRKRLVESGRARVKKYSWARMAKQTLQVYRRALKA